jgi:hypothetical protein
MEIPGPEIRSPQLHTLEHSELVEFTGFQKSVKRGVFGSKQGLLGLKKGQNTGFAVTDSSTEQKCKLLIYCKLHEIKWSKKDFHRVRGGDPSQGIGSRD